MDAKKAEKISKGAGRPQPADDPERDQEEQVLPLLRRFE